MDFSELENEIIKCNKCKRLRDWSQTRKGTNEKYKDEDYWGLPVPGFGDHNARILIVGLAPGAHGANRTGRPFTGDIAGNHLFDVLCRYKFSNRSTSEIRDEDLILTDVYITNAIKCAPPDNEPKGEEFSFCREYLRHEIESLGELKVIVALGEKAFNQVKKTMKELGVNVSGKEFVHKGVYNFGSSHPVLVTSYHTSKYNFDTGVMTIEKLNDVMKLVTAII